MINNCVCYLIGSLTKTSSGENSEDYWGITEGGISIAFLGHGHIVEITEEWQ